MLLNSIYKSLSIQKPPTTSSPTFAVYSLCDAEKMEIALSSEKFCVFVTDSFMQAKKLCRLANEFLGENSAEVLSEKDDVLLFKENFSFSQTLARNCTLAKLANGLLKCLIVTIDSLANNFCDFSVAKQSIVEFTQNGSYNFESIAKTLANFSYKKCGFVEKVGEFAIRGDICDIFSPHLTQPIRLEFFGNRLEKIKIFDIESQKSVQNISNTQVFACTNGYKKEEIDIAMKQFDKELKENSDEKLENIFEKLLLLKETNPQNLSFDFLDCYLPKNSLTEFLPKDTLVIFDEAKKIRKYKEDFYRQYFSRLDGFLQAKNCLKSHTKQLASEGSLFEFADNFQRAEFANFLSQWAIVSPQELIKCNSVVVQNYKNNFAVLKKDIQNWLFFGYKIVLCCGDKAQETTYSFGNFGAKLVDGNTQNLQDCSLATSELEISEGYVNHDRKFVLIGKNNLFREEKRKIVRKSNVFFGAKTGDFVVHETYGIAKCLGISKITKGSSEKEYLQLEFFGGDKLYLPCDNLEALTKYSGSDSIPKLSKLGGKEFEREKQKVRSSIKELAFNIKKLYAERNQKKGFVYPADNVFTEEFDDAFPYEETADQLRAVEEIKQDMQSEKIMDRLLCGDVGFGKTEVALRAGFRAILASKQVAFMSPTTLLSEQHFSTMQQRFAGTGIKIAKLNRFCSKKEIEQTLQGLKDGSISMVSGTHRLLSKDVEFADLGLLILDEEQRFGVADKEKLKLYKNQVDVLTLSATPIPRTLHMSLSKIRDISILATPPSERIAVATYVCEFSEHLLCDVLNKELARGGQAYVLYNNVANIDKFTARLKDLLPDAKISVAHGQMKQNIFEDNIARFYKGESDILVCSTIIENGIDIQNANTMFVVDADHFGLAQLYQLRGRVGRSNKIASAYFTFDGEKVLTENAYKRLSSISEYTELGSGFRLSMRDLEIRGAGDVLGARQSGQIAKVGYEYYVKILNEEVDKMLGKEQKIACEVDADILAYLPQNYVEDTEQRIATYQNLSQYQKIEDVDLAYAETEDVFGKMPYEAENLFLVAKARIYAQNLQANSIKVKKEGAGIFFATDKVLKNENLSKAEEKYGKEIFVAKSEKPIVIFNTKGKKLNQIFLKIVEFLQMLNE